MKAHIVMPVLWQRTQWGQGRTFEKTAEYLSKQAGVGDVTCVFPPITKRRRWSAPFREERVGSQLTLLTPCVRPFPDSAAPFRLWNYLNEHALHAIRLTLWLRGYRRKNTILWPFPPCPHLSELARIVPYRTCVGQIVDNFTVDRGTNSIGSRRRAEEQYGWVSETADRIIVGSQAMKDHFSETSDSVLLMENGVDPIFIQAPTELPHRVSNGKPRIGYVGFLSSRTDIELMVACANARPDWDFVIAGPVHDADPLQIETLERTANIKYLGFVPYQELPALIGSFDVCTIPHRRTELSQAMSPLKAFQYAGSGRPIVATDVAGLDKFRGVIRVATECDAFTRCIGDALLEHTPDDAERMIALASEETWESRISIMFESVRENMNWID